MMAPVLSPPSSDEVLGFGGGAPDSEVELVLELGEEDGLDLDAAPDDWELGRVALIAVLLSLLIGEELPPPVGEL